MATDIGSYPSTAALVPLKNSGVHGQSEGDDVLNKNREIEAKSWLKKAAVFKRSL